MTSRISFGEICGGLYTVSTNDLEKMPNENCSLQQRTSRFNGTEDRHR